MNSPPSDRHARWSAFLASIRKRVDEICAEAYAGGQALAMADPTNPVALLTAQAAIGTRIDTLGRKIEDVWHKEEIGDGRGPAQDRALGERDATKRYLFESWTTCRVRSLAEYFRTMWPHVERELAKAIVCSRCGAPLSPTQRNKSESLTCPHCTAANLVLPDPIVTTWFSHAPQHVAAEQCLAMSLGLLRANEDVSWWIEGEYRRTGERPKESAASKQRRVEMAFAYYAAFVAAKARMVPTPKAEQDAEIARSVANFEALFP